MHIILGGTGHVGRATARALLARGEPVTVVTRTAERAEDLRGLGAAIAVADIHDTEGLRAVFRQGKRLFALNPPASPEQDPDAEERRTIASILSATEGSGLEKVVGHSTYGARKGKNIGDLGTLFELEQGLQGLSIPTSILRAAYYMTNWEMSLELARREGILTTFFPADFRLAMVAPQDLGEAAAELMTDPPGKIRVVHAEGPERYTSNDVATALSDLFNRTVKVASLPPERWEETFLSFGFSQSAARSYAGMTRLAVTMPVPDLSEVRRGKVGLRAYLEAATSGSRGEHQG